MRWPQWLSKTGLARLIPRVYLGRLGWAGKMSGKERANLGRAQSKTKEHLKL